MTEDLEHKVKLDIPINEAAADIQFQYKYPFAFTTIAQAFLQKYNYEPRTQLTTAGGVQQLDDDRFMFYRRVDTVFTNEISYERVIYDRRNGGSITNELIRPRPDGERLFERGVITSENDGASAQHNHFVYDSQGIKTLKIDFFKNGVEKVIKAIKFAQFDAQQ